ncbi:MAG TPA: response regulator [Longimicrobiaceae bacterium]|nr:response regulator [Longimicrobiaceae bacterium]
MHPAIQILHVGGGSADALLYPALSAVPGELHGEVAHTPSYERGIELLRDLPFDVVLLDSSIGDAAALGFLDTISERGRVVPPVILLASGGADASRAGLRARVDEYLTGDEITPRLLAVSIRRLAELHRTRIEKAEIEQRYRSLVTMAPQAIYALDDGGRFVELNPAGEQLLGRSAGDLRGQPYKTVVAPVDMPIADQAFASVLAGAERPVDIDVRIVRPSGEERLLRVTTAATTEDGRITGTHGIARDITERRVVERRMRMLTSTIEGLEEGVSVVDAEGHYLFTNAAHARILGYPEGQPPEAGVSSFVPDAAAQETLEEILATARERGGWSGRVQLRRLDNGQVVPLDVMMGIVEDSGASLIFSIVQDSTQKISDERRLRQVERLASVGTLIGGVAHELNNPLHAIRNLAEVLLMDARPEQDREDLEIIRREADRMAKIVADLRVLGRETEAEASGAEKMEVDLNEIVRHVLSARRYSFSTGNVEVREDLAQSLPPLWGHRGQLEQLVLNLVLNAEQAVAERRGERRIILRTRATPGGAALHVVDNGPGISGAHMERIFDPFFTTKRVGEGTGLGLSLVYSIVREHGAEIHVDSEVGNGAAFRVDLPRAPRSRPSLSSTESSELAAVRRRILVVDDEASVRRSIVRFLTRRGHQVGEAVEGEQALARLAEADYDVILSDLRMPGMAGDELLERLHERGLAERVIFMTGDAASKHAARFFASQGTPVLLKPLTLMEIADAVEGHPTGAME